MQTDATATTRPAAASNDGSRSRGHFGLPAALRELRLPADLCSTDRAQATTRTFLPQSFIAIYGGADGEPAVGDSPGWRCGGPVLLDRKDALRARRHRPSATLGTSPAPVLALP